MAKPKFIEDELVEKIFKFINELKLKHNEQDEYILYLSIKENGEYCDYHTRIYVDFETKTIIFDDDFYEGQEEINLLGITPIYDKALYKYNEG